jgi:para-nitrobenzyl esterase
MLLVGRRRCVALTAACLWVAASPIATAAAGAADVAASAAPDTAIAATRIASATPGTAVAAASAASAAPEVRIDTGGVRGHRANGVVSFKGIPFAAPPVGDARWRAPGPPSAWVDVRDGSSFGPACPQTAAATDKGRVRTSEDCLTINVWKPAHARPSSGSLPVMVWIYGGAFIDGASSSPWYDGAALARQGVIVVSFNYRVGRLGFFAHPALTRAAAPDEMLANYGFMDQIAALQWVQRNIAAFDGDPANVTLFGQSAGGASVNMLMLAPPAQGLFAKAISESGFPRWGGKPLRGVADSAENDGIAFAMRNGISGETPETAARLRALPIEKVMDLGPMDENSLWPAPIVDGKILPKNAAVLIAAGRLAAVPLMVGGTSCDASIYCDRYLAAFRIKDSANYFAEPSGQAFESLYPGAPRDAAVSALTDRIETEPVRFQARMHTDTGRPAWVYYFDYRHAGEARRPGECAGSPHASEIGFVFGTFDREPPFAGMQRLTPNADDRRLSRQMMGYWTSFAKRGDPNGPGAPQWPAFDRVHEPVLVFSAQGPVVRPHYRAAQLDWIESKLDAPWVW